MKIVEHFLTLDINENGWSKELNLVSFNNDRPIFDIRYWSPEKKAGKGIRLTEKELRKLTKYLLKKEK